MPHSKNYEVLKAKFLDKGCTKEQLLRFTKVTNPNYSITFDEYNEIVGVNTEIVENI